MVSKDPEGARSLFHTSEEAKRYGLVSLESLVVGRFSSAFRMRMKVLLVIRL